MAKPHLATGRRSWPLALRAAQLLGQPGGQHGLAASWPLPNSSHSQPHEHRDGMGTCWPCPSAFHGKGSLWPSGMVYLAGRAHGWTPVAQLECESQSSKLAAAVQVGRGVHVLTVTSQDHSQELQSLSSSPCARYTLLLLIHHVESNKDRGSANSLLAEQ